MANAFWGGFAETLLGERVKERDRLADEKSLEKRMRLQKELEAEYETTEIEDVDPATGKPVIVRINGKGEKKGQRFMTMAEAENRQLKKRQLLAEITGAEARAEVSGKEAKNYDADHARKVANEQADNARGAASLAIQQASLDNQIASGKRSEAREERIAAAALENNSAEVLAQSQLAEAAQVLSTSARDKVGARRAMTTLQGAINMILADPKLNNVQKKNMIKSTISRFKAQVPLLKAPTADTSGDGLSE